MKVKRVKPKMRSTRLPTGDDAVNNECEFGRGDDVKAAHFLL